jgi:hypothetical protein
MLNEAHTIWSDRSLREILAKSRREGCEGLTSRAEQLGKQPSGAAHRAAGE